MPGASPGKRLWGASEWLERAKAEELVPGRSIPSLGLGRLGIFVAVLL